MTTDADRGRGESQSGAAGTENLSRFIANLADAVVVFDAAARIRLVNDCAEKLFGFTRAELLGKSLHFLLPEYVSKPSESLGASVPAVTAASRSGGRFPAQMLLSDWTSGAESWSVAVIRRASRSDFPAQRPAETKPGALAGRSKPAARLSARSRGGQVKSALQASEARFRLLSDLASLWSGGEDTELRIKEVCGKILRGLDCEVVFNFLSDARSSKLHLNAYSGISEAAAKTMEWLDYGVAVCGSAALTREPVVIEDIPHSSDPRAQMSAGLGIKAHAAYPLLAGGRLIGTLSFGKTSRTHFSCDERALMKAVADQMAMTIDRTQSEQALRRSRQQLAGILESAMDAIISVDANRKIALFNRAAEKMFQCPVTEAIGATLDRFLPERFRAAHDEHMRHFGATGETSRKMGKLGTVYGLRANGEEFPIEASISQMNSGGQKLFTVIIRDITRRVREEATLRRQAELIHLSHDAIFVWNDARGIEFWSEGAARLYGYDAHETEGLLPQALFEQSFPTPWAEIEGELREHGLWEGELRRQTKSDSEVFVSCRLQFVSDAGSASVILETDRDITERRRLEKEVLEVSNAEQRRIGQDLHDGLCQHLTGIEFRASALADQLADSPEIRREIASINSLIRDGARQARMLSRGLLPVSLEDGGLDFALKELTENSARLFGKPCRFDCPVPVSISDNQVATHLYRIAQEAISNAARHAEAKMIRVALNRTDEEIVLSITDDGRGLPPTAARSGGMGLRIMRYRAEMIGALLKIKTAKGGGTSLVCVLKGV